MKRFGLFLVIFLLVSAVFADKYYVCLGSYTNSRNCEAFVSKLKNNGIDTVVASAESKGKVVSRVLFSEAFDNIDDARKKAETLKNDPTVKKLGLTGLWPVSADVSDNKKTNKNRKVIVLEPVVESNSVPLVLEEPKAIQKIEPEKETVEPVQDAAVETESVKNEREIPVDEPPVSETQGTENILPEDNAVANANEAVAEPNAEPEKAEENSSVIESAVPVAVASETVVPNVETPSAVEENPVNENSETAETKEETEKTTEEAKSEETAAEEAKPEENSNEAKTEESEPAAEKTAGTTEKAPIKIKFPSMKLTNEDSEEVQLLTPDTNLPFFSVKKMRTEIPTFVLTTYEGGAVIEEVTFRRIKGKTNFEIVREGEKPVVVKPKKPCTVKVYLSGNLGDYTTVTFDWNKAMNTFKMSESFVDKYTQDFSSLQ